MVDALREAHRVLAEGGILIDARPDSRVDARVQRGSGPRFVTVGALGTRRDTETDDRLSDRAIAAAKHLRLFRGGPPRAARRAVRDRATAALRGARQALAWSWDGGKSYMS